MSIVIRGMEMPKDGNWKTVRIYPDGTCAVPYWSGDCKVLDCTAIPIPEGHGDLIERKSLHLVLDYKDVRNGIKHIVKETKRDGRVITGISIELLEQTLVALDELRSVRRYFENAKTIVPADVTDIDVGNKKKGGADDV